MPNLNLLGLLVYSLSNEPGQMRKVRKPDRSSWQKVLLSYLRKEMKKPERPGQREFRQGVIDQHKDKFGCLFCRMCPVDKSGFDDDGNQIPFDAHHTGQPYSQYKNQDPSIGALICREGHQRQIHTPFGGITRIGVRLMSLFNEDPDAERYAVGNTCPYKTETGIDITEEIGRIDLPSLSDFNFTGGENG